MIRKIILWSLFITIAVVCVVWFTILILNTMQKEQMRYGVAQLRAERAAESRGPIVIGVAGADGEYLDVKRGIDIALKEINNSGGINGRMIKLISKADEGNIITGRHIAQQFSDNVDMVAVIGHIKSEISVPVSVIYQYYGMLMISPLSVSAKLTSQGHRLIFRTISNDLDIGKQIAGFFSRKGYKNIAIYYQRDEYGMSIATSFENNATNLELNIVDRLSFEIQSTRKQLRDSLRSLKRFYNFDAIFLAGELPHSAILIQEARKAGIKVPIITDENLNRKQLIQQAGRDAEGTIVMSIFDANDKDPVVKAFMDKYKEKYKSVPGHFAAQGYDSLKLLAYAMKTAKSTVPTKVAHVLHNTKDWKGVTGLYTFDKNGDVVNKRIGKRIVRGGKFVSLQDDLHP